MSSTTTVKLEAKQQLENLLDSTCIEWVVDQLREICFEKAQHVRENWNDESIAKAWDSNGKLLDRISDKVKATF